MKSKNLTHSTRPTSAQSGLRMLSGTHTARPPSIKQLKGALDMAGEMASDRAKWIDTMLAAGDQMAHDLLYRQHKRVLDRWWKLREGSCTVCYPELHNEN
jgi:hypothetical protein